MSNVTTVSIVNEMQTLIDEAKQDKKLDLEKRIKLITSLTDRQLRAGALSLAWARSVSRIPEDVSKTIPALNAIESIAATSQTKQ